MSTQRPKQSNCHAWNMQVMRLALPEGSATVKLPEARLLAAVCFWRNCDLN